MGEGMQVKVTKKLRVPWSVIKSHEAQAQKNHSQSLTRLNERGGLSVCEAVAILEDRRWREMNEQDALFRLVELIQSGGNE